MPRFFFFQIPSSPLTRQLPSYERTSVFIYLLYINDTQRKNTDYCILSGISRCGNVASILELDEHLGQEYKVFQHAPVVSDHIYLYYLLNTTSLRSRLFTISIFVQIIFLLSWLVTHETILKFSFTYFISGCSINSRETSSCRLLPVELTQ